MRLVQIFAFDSHETVSDNILKHSMFNVALFTRLMNIHAQLISSQVNRFAGADSIRGVASRAKCHTIDAQSIVTVSNCRDSQSDWAEWKRKIRFNSEIKPELRTPHLTKITSFFCQRLLITYLWNRWKISLDSTPNPIPLRLNEDASTDG